MESHFLAVGGRFQQLIDGFFVGIGGFISQKTIHQGKARRQSRQVKAKSPEQVFFVGFGVWGKADLLLLMQHKIVDLIFWPLVIAHIGPGRFFGSHKRPVLFVGSTLLYPLLDQLDLVRRQLQIRRGRGHLH